MSNAIEPGQRRSAIVGRQAMVVRTVRRASNYPCHWICIAEDNDDPILVHERDFGNLLADTLDLDGDT